MLIVRQCDGSALSVQGIPSTNPYSSILEHAIVGSNVIDMRLQQRQASFSWPYETKPDL